MYNFPIAKGDLVYEVFDPQLPFIVHWFWRLPLIDGLVGVKDIWGLKQIKFLCNLYPAQDFGVFVVDDIWDQLWLNGQCIKHPNLYLQSQIVYTPGISVKWRFKNQSTENMDSLKDFASIVSNLF